MYGGAPVRIEKFLFGGGKLKSNIGGLLNNLENFGDASF